MNSSSPMPNQENDFNSPKIPKAPGLSHSLMNFATASDLYGAEEKTEVSSVTEINSRNSDIPDEPVPASAIDWQQASDDEITQKYTRAELRKVLSTVTPPFDKED